MPKILSLSKILVDHRQKATLSPGVTKKGSQQYIFTAQGSSHSFSSLDKLHSYLLKQRNVDTWEIQDLSNHAIIYKHKTLDEIETFNSERELNHVFSKETNGAWKVIFVNNVIPNNAKDLLNISDIPQDYYVIDQSGWFSTEYENYSLAHGEDFLAAVADKENQQMQSFNWSSWGLSLLSVSRLIFNTIPKATQYLSELPGSIFIENYPTVYPVQFALGSLTYALGGMSDSRTSGVITAAVTSTLFLKVNAQSEATNHLESFLDDRASQVSTNSFYADVLNPKIRIKIITLTDGNFTIIWQDQGLRSYCRYISADGIFLSPQFSISNESSLFDATSLSGSTEFVVALSSQTENNSATPSQWELFLHRFNFVANDTSYSLVKEGEEYLMGRFNITDQDAAHPLIAGLTFEQDLVAAWLSYNVSYEIVGRCCTHYCYAGKPFKINNNTLTVPVSPSMVVLSPSNNFTFVWATLNNIYLRNYANPSCSTSYPEEHKFYSTLSMPSPVLAITNSSGDGLVIIWEGKDMFSGNLGIFGLQIEAKGIASGGDFKVSNNSSRQNTLPATASFSGDYEDYFAVIWVSSDLSVGNATILHGRFFRISPNISPVTEEFIISNNTAPLALQKNYYPTMESLPPDKVVISWYGGVNNTYFVYARIFELSKLLPLKPDNRLIVGVMGGVVLVSLVGGIVYHCKKCKNLRGHEPIPSPHPELHPTLTTAAFVGLGGHFSGTVDHPVVVAHQEIHHHYENNPRAESEREQMSRAILSPESIGDEFQDSDAEEQMLPSKNKKPDAMPLKSINFKSLTNQGVNTMPKFQTLIIAADNRPSDRDYAVLSDHVYGGSKLKKGDVPKDSPEWKVVETKSMGQFFGAIYKHKKTNQVVAAYRGTQSIGDLIEDLRGIFNNNELSLYKEAAFELTQTAIGLAEDAESGLSFTGHSLGGYLAEMSVYYCHAYYPQKKAHAAQAAASAAGEDDDNDADVDDKVGNVISAVSEFDIRDSVHAVTFESPGTRDVIEKLQSQLDAGQVNLTQLDIITYLSYPNLINTCNQHVGTAYSFEPEIRSWSNVPGWHLKQVHTMMHIVDLFNKAKGQCPERHFMLDWPQGNQRSVYFENVKLQNNKYEWTKSPEELSQDFKFVMGSHFRIDRGLSNWQVIPLKHFSRPMQEWLLRFYTLLTQRSQKPGFLEQVKVEWQGFSVDPHIISYLLSMILVKENLTKMVYLSITSENATHITAFIRRELSRWLSENSEKANQILDTLLSLQDQPDIQAALLGPGARLTATGVIENPQVAATFVEIPSDTNPQMLEHFKQVSYHFMKTLKDNNIKMAAYLAAPGAVIEGRITNPVVRAVEFRVGTAPKVGERIFEINLPLSSKPKEISPMPGTDTRTATTSTGATSSSAEKPSAPAVIGEDIIPSSKDLKAFVSNPHSLEAYLAEFEKNWPKEFIELCVASEEAQPLIDYIKNAKLTDPQTQWLILCAAHYATVDQVKALVKARLVNALKGTEKGLTVMHIAMLMGNDALVTAAEELGFDLDKAAAFGAYRNVQPIHCAIVGGNCELFEKFKNEVTFKHIRYQLGEGDRNYIELGWLSLAAYTGQVAVIQALLKGFSREVLSKISYVQGEWGGNILHIAVENFRQAVLDELLSHEYFRELAYLEGTDTHGLTPFALAAKLGNIGAMRSLKAKDAKIEMPTQTDELFKDYQPLHLATEFGEEEAVDWLIAWDVDVTSYCSVGDEEITAQQLANRRAREAVKEIATIKEFDLRQAWTGKEMQYTALETKLKKYATNKKLKRFEPTTAKKVTYKNLVFKGGGPKGLVYVGALLKLLEKWQGNNELKNLSSIERVAGTSAGAIIAVLLAVGYMPHEINELLQTPENQPKEFLDGKPLSLLSEHTVSSKIVEGLKTTALHPMQVGALLVNLARKDSICKGEYFLNLIEGHIKRKTGKDWCTFGELRELVENQTERKFRHLHVVTIRVRPNTRIEVLSSEDPRYKDYSIAHAIRASMSIPVLFQPAKLYQVNITPAGERSLVVASDAEYIDGGVLANYPLKLFDQARYVHQGLHLFRDERSKEFPVYNEATLGFYIKPETPIDEAVYKTSGKLSMKDAVTTLYSSTEDRVHEFEQSSRRSIEIGNAGVTLFDFDLSADQKAALLKAGQDAVDASPLVTPNRSIPPRDTASLAVLRQGGGAVVSAPSLASAKKPIRTNDDDDNDKISTDESKELTGPK
jgi:NTE family protein